jgi:hypothetical protein
MTMGYRALGGTGIEVSAYCLGAMMFGSVGGTAVDAPAPGRRPRRCGLGRTRQPLALNGVNVPSHSL